MLNRKVTALLSAACLALTLALPAAAAASIPAEAAGLAETAGPDLAAEDPETETETESAALYTDKERSVSVSASGTVSVVPDMAEIAFSIVTEGEDAQAAQEENTGKVDSVLKALKDLGVKEESIMTSDYSISPEYDYDQDPAKLTGYQVRTSLTVSDQKIGDSGRILSAAVDAGVNDVSGVTYTCSTYDQKYQQALEKAMDAAKEKAETLAAASGLKPGLPLDIQEGYQDTSARYQPSADDYDSDMIMMSKTASDESSAVSMNPGSMEIKASVSVTYELIQ